MRHRLWLFRSVKVLLLFMALLAGPTAVEAAGGPESHLSQGHRMITGVVTEKAGALAVTTPAGASHQLNANLSRRHGHPPFKTGDEVIAELDENNYIVDMHLKGEEGTHHLVTGTLIHVGKTKKEIKLHTREGEQVFPLAEQGLKTKDLPNGSRVTVELNEAGAVIDLHQADPGTEKQ
jgi:hypothetical protein